MEGQGIARCRKCHRILTNSDAISAGYGPVCFRKLTGRSLAHSPTNSNQRQIIGKKSHKTRGRHVLANQISVFDAQEGPHGTDTQESC